MSENRTTEIRRSQGPGVFVVPISSNLLKKDGSTGTSILTVLKVNILIKCRFINILSPLLDLQSANFDFLSNKG